MLIDPFIDNHIHTALCHHATGTMSECVLQAIKKGMREINFLEHMEEGVVTRRTTWLNDDDFEFYFAEGATLQEIYGSKINIGLGVEVGFNPHFTEKILQRLAARKWDLVGLSYHFHKYDKYHEHLNLVSRRDKRVQNLERSEAGRILSEYFTTLCEAVKTIPCDMICHLDAALRYYPGIRNIDLPWPIIDKLLNEIKQRDIAIELNTSGLAIRGEIFPCREIVARASKRNITFLAGSDSHSPNTIGYGFESLNRLLTRY